MENQKIITLYLNDPVIKRLRAAWMNGEITEYGYIVEMKVYDNGGVVNVDIYTRQPAVFND